jgi:GDP-mannose 6-dehydrogenase
MRIAIVGLGHLGSVTAGCLAKVGHEVIGVDRDRTRVAAINKGQSPVKEVGLAAFIRSARREGRLSGADQISRQVLDCELILVCVDTPPEKRSLGLKNVVRVCEKLVEVNHPSKAIPLLVMRSTLPPGAYDSVLAPFCSSHGNLRMAYNPDFTREGSAVADFMNPGRIVIGVRERRDAEKVRQLYRSFEAEIFVTAWNNAEILKCAENAFHALKICFANEIATICESFGADGEKVMSLLCADTRLNISPVYLHPGLPFGGPCLHKDIDALLSGALRQTISAPLIKAILESNRKHFERIVRTIKKARHRVGFLGLSHKAGVSDHRGSHLFALAERLHAEGVMVRAFDPGLAKRRVSGGHKQALSIRSDKNSEETVRNSDLIFTPRRLRGMTD